MLVANLIVWICIMTSPSFKEFPNYLSVDRRKVFFRGQFLYTGTEAFLVHN